MNNRQVQSEILSLVEQRVLTKDAAKKIAAQYPVTAWDVLVLVRWLTWLGALAAGAGAVVLVSEKASWLRLAEFGLAGVALAAFYAGQAVLPRKGFSKTAAAVELLGAMALQGWIVALAVEFSTGSKNWPALVGACAVATGACAYGLANRLILVLALVNVFVFFGGETGYVSGWGAYWLGMDYPLRFVAAGLLSIAVAAAHAEFPRYQSFARVYTHFGLLSVHLALWFFSLFGFFNGKIHWDDDNAHQRLAFSLLWAVISLGCLWLGSWLGQRVFRAYGLVFLIINVYTFYFQFIVEHSAELWFLHVLVTGGSLVALGILLEKRLNRNQG